MVRALFPGSFDPVTLGHLDLVHRGLDMFESLTLGVARNISKQAVFSLEERVEMLEECLPDSPTLSVITFSGLMVDFCREQGYGVIVRGLRSSSDFEYEFQLANMNRVLAPDVESLFLTPSEQYSYISSSLVREIAALNGDVTKFVHPTVNDALIKRYHE